MSAPLTGKMADAVVPLALTLRLWLPLVVLVVMGGDKTASSSILSLLLGKPLPPSHGPGAPTLKSVSVGGAGVWAVDLRQGVWYKHGTWNHPEDPGNHWISVPDKRLMQVDVGRDTVWGVDHNHNVYVRQQLTCNTPFGIRWQQVTGPSFIHVTVSPRGSVWAVHYRGDVYYRSGITHSNRTGTGWRNISGVKMKQLSAGSSGVWGLAWNEDKAYYRVGTYGDKDVIGLGWLALPGTHQLRSLCSANQRVIAVNTYGEVSMRQEMYVGNPVGMYWRHLEDQLDAVDCHGDDVWGVNNTTTVFKTILIS